MKSITRFMGVAVLSCAAAGVASGAVIVQESFPHSDGNLVGQTPAVGGTWAAHSGGGSLPVQVTSGAAVLAQGGGSREDVNVPFSTGAIGTGDVVYAGFDLTVPDPGADITDVYFAHFLEGTSAFDARVWITAPTTSGYRLAISNDNSITDNDGEVFTADLNFGQTYRVVTKYDYDGMSAMLWIDPVSEASPSISATDPGFSDEVSAYAFRQAAGNTSMTIDNLIVATTAAEAIPEPASAGVLALAALGLLGRRRP